MGAGAPPLKTTRGWLHFYHGVGEKDGKKAYRLGVILAPLESPHTVAYVSPEPVLEPEQAYEVHGWVPEVVFTCGAVPKYKDSDQILDEDDVVLVYYGGADEVMGVAEARIGDLIPPSCTNSRSSSSNSLPLIEAKQTAETFTALDRSNSVFVCRLHDKGAVETLMWTL